MTESSVGPIPDQNGPGKPNQGGGCICDRKEPLGMAAGDANLNVFLKETFYHWLMLVYRSLHVESVQVLWTLSLKFVKLPFGVWQQNRFDLLERM